MYRLGLLCKKKTKKKKTCACLYRRWSSGVPRRSPSGDIMCISRVTVQPATGLRGLLFYMQAETAEAIDWLHGHMGGVHVAAGGLAGSTGSPAALKASTCYYILF